MLLDCSNESAVKRPGLGERFADDRIVSIKDPTGAHRADTVGCTVFG